MADSEAFEVLDMRRVPNGMRVWWRDVASGERHVSTVVDPRLARHFKRLVWGDGSLVAVVRHADGSWITCRPALATYQRLRAAGKIS